MPSRSNHPKNARPTRIRVAGRQNKTKHGRKECIGATQENPAVIANSIFALTLTDKPAIKVKAIKSGGKLRFDDEDYDQMYKDVLNAVQNAVYLVTGERTTFNPLHSGFDLSQSFDFVLNMFRNQVLPEKWNFNIEKYPVDYKGGRYHLVIYHDCEFQTFWHAFSIRPLVLGLQADKKLHDLFIKFLWNFIHKTKIDCWWGGALGYCDENSMIDEFEQHEFDSDEEWLDALVSLHITIDDYEKGNAKKYEKLLKNQPIVPVDTLRKEISKFSARNKLVKWMMDACEFMEVPYSLTDFVYPEFQDEEGFDALMFDSQSGVLWDVTDEYSLTQERFLDSIAQGCGIFYPIYNFRIDHLTTSINIEEIKKAILWPQQLTKLFHSFNDAAVKYEFKN